MKTLLRILSLIIAALCASQQLIAQVQVPTLMNYQGQLANADGTPLPTGDYTLTFSVYDAAHDGSLIWGPQVFDGGIGQGHGPKIPVVQGYFNVMLGAVDTTNRSLSEAFSASSRFVEIKLGDDSPISPRQQLLSAPFAFSALRADQAENTRMVEGVDLVNESTQTLNPEVVEVGSIPATAIVPNSISSGQLATNSVQASEISAGQVQSAKIDALAVGTSKLADGAVTRPKIAINAIDGPKISNDSITVDKIASMTKAVNAGLGDVAESGMLGFITSSASYVVVPGSTVSLQTSGGRPVLAAIVPWVGKESLFRHISSGGETNTLVSIERDGGSIGAIAAFGGSSTGSRSVSGALVLLDFPPAGNHSYRIKIRTTGDSGRISDCKLVVFEL